MGRVWGGRGKEGFVREAPHYLEWRLGSSIVLTRYTWIVEGGHVLHL